MRTGLVLEGGGMRGMFSAGILDVLMEAGIEFDGMVGVSAGACFGCNYKSKQKGRALRYNQRFGRDPRYMGLRSLLTTGNLVNAEFAYHVVPSQYDIFDAEAFRLNPMEFHLVCTDAMTGEPVYKQLSEVNYETLEWIRATASMPGVSRPVPLEGKLLLDGGISDSIPLRYFQQQGYDRNLVILTQPRGYFKKPSFSVYLLRIFAHRYPAIIKAMERRYLMYNEQLRYLQNEADAGRVMVLCPDEPLSISRLEGDSSQLQRVYDVGRAKGLQHLEAICTYLGQKASKV